MTSTLLRRFEGIQALRFFAAFLVVVTHASFYVYERLDNSFPVWKTGGIMGVDIFFVISGFVMVIASRDRNGDLVSWNDFLFRRAKRILPMYWVATTVNLAILLLLPTTVLHSTLDIPAIIKSYLLIPAHNADGRVEPLVGVGWTLYFEFFFYFVFALALFLRTNTFVLVGGVLTLVAAGSMFKTSNDPAVLVLLDPIVLSFFAGMLLARYARGITLPSLVGFALVAIGFAFGAAARELAPNAPTLFARVVPATIIVLGVILAERTLVRVVPAWMLFLGNASYVIYLFHPIVSAAVPFAFAKLGLPSPVVAFVCSVLAGVLLPALLHRTVEVPVLRKAGLAH